MDAENSGTSALDALSDEEYRHRVHEMVGTVTDRIEDALESDDPVEAELLHAAAPAALSNLLALMIAEECVGQPRPFKMVKEAVRELDLEGMALAILKDLQAQP